MRPPRFRVRTLMALVVAAALLLGIRAHWERLQRIQKANYNPFSMSHCIGHTATEASTGNSRFDFVAGETVPIDIQYDINLNLHDPKPPDGKVYRAIGHVWLQNQATDSIARLFSIARALKKGGRERDSGTATARVRLDQPGRYGIVDLLSYLDWRGKWSEQNGGTTMVFRVHDPRCPNRMDASRLWLSPCPCESSSARTAAARLVGAVSLEVAGRE